MIHDFQSAFVHAHMHFLIPDTLEGAAYPMIIWWGIEPHVCMTIQICQNDPAWWRQQHVYDYDLIMQSMYILIAFHSYCNNNYYSVQLYTCLHNKNESINIIPYLVWFQMSQCSFRAKYDIHSKSIIFILFFGVKFILFLV